MFRLILYMELREIIGSKKFAFTFGICSILIITAFFSGIKNYQAGLTEYNASKAAGLQKLETVTDWAEVNDHQVFLPPSPLAYLIMGVSNDLPRTANINGSASPALSDSIYSEKPVYAVFRFLDLEFVFQIVLSLFAILFAFNAVNGERENGTLKLVFSNALPRAVYILGKLAGSFLALALPLLLPVFTGLLLLPLTGINLSSDEWIRLMLFILCGLLYLGVFLTLSVFMSCLTRRSSSSFLFLLVIWTFFVLIVPRASVLMAGHMVEVPSSAEISFRLARLGRQQSIDMEKKINEYMNREQKNGFGSSPEDLERRQKKINEFCEILNSESKREEQELAGRLNEERRNRQAGQEKLAFGISRISPAAVFSLAATELGGTSIGLKHHFQKMAAAYSKSFAEFIREKTGRSIGGQMNIAVSSNFSLDEKSGQVQRIDPAEIPEFVYRPPELSGILHRASPDIAILLLFNLIFFCGAFLAFLRFDLH